MTKEEAPKNIGDESDTATVYALSQNENSLLFSFRAEYSFCFEAVLLKVEFSIRES